MLDSDALQMLLDRVANKGKLTTEERRECVAKLKDAYSNTQLAKLLGVSAKQISRDLEYLLAQDAVVVRSDDPALRIAAMASSISSTFHAIWWRPPSGCPSRNCV